MQPTETVLTGRLVKVWRQMGAEVLNIHGNKYQAPGWPDTFVCHKHWTGFIEFKGPTTRVEPHQLRIIKALERTTNVWIVRFIELKQSIWIMGVYDSSLTEQVRLHLTGTDGQVAASLLKELGALEC